MPLTMQRCMGRPVKSLSEWSYRTRKHSADVAFEVTHTTNRAITSAQHGSRRQVRNGTTRLSQDAFGGGPAQAVEKSVRTIGRHHDEVRANLRGGLQDSVRWFAGPGQAVPRPTVVFGEPHRGHFGSGPHVQECDYATGNWRLRIRRAAASTLGCGRGLLVTGMRMFRREIEPSCLETKPSTPWGMKRVICPAARAIGFPTDFSSQRKGPSCCSNRKHDQILGMLFQKAKTGFHRIITRRDDFVDFDTEPSNRTLWTSAVDNVPPLKHVADAGEILPFGTGTRSDVEHCKVGLGHQCDLQGMREGDFAGLGKIGRMKNRLYFSQVVLTHSPCSFCIRFVGPMGPQK